MDKPKTDAGAIVEQWFREHVCNSPLSQQTEIYNHLHIAKDKLKALLNEPTAAEAPSTKERT